MQPHWTESMRWFGEVFFHDLRAQSKTPLKREVDQKQAEALFLYLMYQSGKDREPDFLRKVDETTEAQVRETIETNGQNAVDKYDLNSEGDFSEVGLGMGALAGGAVDHDAKGDGVTLTQAGVAAAILLMAGGSMAENRSKLIGATETVSSGNYGLLASAVSTRLPLDKTWVAIMDGRTRATHWRAHGQTVPVDQPFMVGGYPMQHPGDFRAPAWEIVNCRCTMYILLKSLFRTGRI